jgi:hypothetical protein
VSSLNLMALTNLNGGHLTLVPSPTNAANDAVDGTLRVVSSARLATEAQTGASASVLAGPVVSEAGPADPLPVPGVVALTPAGPLLMDSWLVRGRRAPRQAVLSVLEKNRAMFD